MWPGWVAGLVIRIDVVSESGIIFLCWAIFSIETLWIFLCEDKSIGVTVKPNVDRCWNISGDVLICCVGIESSIIFDSARICCGILFNDRFVLIVDAPSVNNEVKCSFNKHFNVSWFNGGCGGGIGGEGRRGGDEDLLVIWRRGRRISFVEGFSVEIAERE